MVVARPAIAVPTVALAPSASPAAKGKLHVVACPAADTRSLLKVALRQTLQVGAPKGMCAKRPSPPTTAERRVVARKSPPAHAKSSVAVQKSTPAPLARAALWGESPQVRAQLAGASAPASAPTLSRMQS
eukprot:scaffold9031_cov68-Phaeocystis_antarctica.AAC.1